MDKKQCLNMRKSYKRQIIETKRGWMNGKIKETEVENKNKNIKLLYKKNW